MHLPKRPLPRPLPLPTKLNTTLFSTTPHPLTTPRSIANLVLTTSIPTHLTQTLLLNPYIPWSEPLVNQTLKLLWNHGPKALQFFTILDRHLTYTHSLSSFHHALDISARLKDYPTTWSLLSRLQSRKLGPTRLTFSIILERYVSGGKPDKAIEIFLSMHQHGVKQDLNAFNTLLDILCKSKRVEKADNFFRLVSRSKKFVADVVSYNILANGWCLIKRTNMGLKVFKEMIDKGIQPSLTSYNIMLKGYFRAGQIREAWEFFKEMKRRGIEADVITYTTLIHGFGIAGEVSRARRVFEGMAKDGILPTVVTYNAFIQVLCRKEDCVDGAVEVFEEMVRKGYVPNEGTYNLLVRGFCHRGEMDRGEEFVELMRKDGCGPNVQTYNLLVRYYCEGGEIDKGLEVFGRMGCLGKCLPNMDTYNILISSMFVRKKSEDLVVAGRLLVEMVDRGFLPTKFNFNRVLNGLLVTGNQGFAREILRLQSKCGFRTGRFRM